MKRIAFLCVFFALCLAFTPLACALDLSFGSFTLTLPSGFKASGEMKNRYDSKNAYIFYFYNIREAMTTQEIIEDDQRYAELPMLMDESSFLKLDPYVVFMLNDEDDFANSELVIDYQGEHLKILIYPKDMENSSLSRSIAESIADSIVFNPPQEDETSTSGEGISLSYGSFLVTLPPEYISIEMEGKEYFIAQDTAIMFDHLQSEERSTQEYVDLANTYASEFYPEAETELIQTEPYISFMLKNPNEALDVLVMLLHDTDMLLLNVRLNHEDMDAACQTAYHILEGVMVSD